MEGRTIFKDEEKKDLSLEKILEIENVYLDLMKAYSSCLTNLNLELLKYQYYPFTNLKIFFTPRITRWRIKGKVYMLEEAFLLLITQNRNNLKIGPKIIEQFELYCGDMDKLRSQFAKSSFGVLFYGSIPVAIITVIFSIFQIIEGNPKNTYLEFIIISIIFYIFLGYVSWVFGFSWGLCNKIFSKANVPEKEEKIFGLIRDYLGFM